MSYQSPVHNFLYEVYLLAKNTLLDAQKVSYNRMSLSWWHQKTIVNPLKNIIKLFRIKKIGNIHFLCHVNGRGDRIRTCDPLHPMQVLYQAELHPDCTRILLCTPINYKYFFGKTCVLSKSPCVCIFNSVRT